jgi:hypothetical protein
MEYNLEKKVILNTESKHKNDYEWSINELAEGKKSEDYIPYDGPLFFNLSSLSIYRELSIVEDHPEVLSNVIKKNQGIVENQLEFSPDKVSVNIYISGELHPEKTFFSMFGTDRKVNKFELSIISTSRSLPEDQQEYCDIRGVQISTPALSEVMEDSIHIFIHVSETRLKEFIRLIENDLIQSASVVLMFVPGIYSIWNPQNRTEPLKVLLEDIGVEGANDSLLKIPRLNTVGDFNIELITSRKMQTEKTTEANTGILKFLGKARKS